MKFSHSIICKYLSPSTADLLALQKLFKINCRQHKLYAVVIYENVESFNHTVLSFMRFNSNLWTQSSKTTWKKCPIKICINKIRNKTLTTSGGKKTVTLLLLLFYFKKNLFEIMLCIYECIRVNEYY